MKKCILCIITVLIVFLCACGKPSNTSDSMYQIGLNALSTADDYIAGKISGEEAESKLEEYNRQSEAQYELSKTEGYENDFKISFALSMLNNAVFNTNRIVNTGTMAEVREKRDALAKELGK